MEPDGGRPGWPASSNRPQPPDGQCHGRVWVQVEGSAGSRQPAPGGCRLIWSDGNWEKKALRTEQEERAERRRFLEECVLWSRCGSPLPFLKTFFTFLTNL